VIINQLIQYYIHVIELHYITSLQQKLKKKFDKKLPQTTSRTHDEWFCLFIYFLNFLKIGNKYYTLAP
jgi:hypothetical protein